MAQNAENFNPLATIEDDRYIHVFEAAGLGKAPFRFVAVWKSYTTCDFCGTGILWNCWILSSDGKSFKVGSECVKRSGDAGLIQASTLAIKKAKKEELREKQAAEQQIRNQAARERREAEKAAERAYEAKMSPYWTKLQQYHKPVADVLLTHDGSDFAIDMMGKLRIEFKAMDEYSSRQIDYMRHLYCKTFGRSNSKAYKKAENRFYVLMERTSDKVRQLKATVPSK